MKLFVLAIAVVATILVGCGDDDDPAASNIESAPDVTGIWEVTGDGIEAEVTYRGDGSYQIAPDAGNGNQVMFDVGSYEVDGNTITYTSSEGVLGCEGGQVGTYTIDVVDEDQWSATGVEDECAARLEGTPFVHMRVDR